MSWKFYVENYDPNITFRSRDNVELVDRAAQVIWAPLLAYAPLRRRPGAQQAHRRPQRVLQGRAARHVASGLLHRAVGRQRAPVRAASRQDSGWSVPLINELMRSRLWDSSAFMWTYDDWGGWYDHVVPPVGGQVRLRLPGARAARQPLRPQGVRRPPRPSTSRRS